MMPDTSHRTLPSWRQSARPGLSLAEARAIAGAPPVKAARSGVELGQIIRPEARSRWLLPRVSNFTPAYIETILRGAIAGNHVQQWELFDLMEDTWPRLAKNLNELKRSVLKLDWKLDAWAEEDMPPSDIAQQKAQVVSRALWAMRPEAQADENDFERTIYDVLDAWAKGTSVLEVLWENRSAGSKLGEIIAPRATCWVHPQNYAWAENGRLGLSANAMQPMGTSFTADIEEFPEHKFLISICKARSGHPLAGALLRPLAFWWAASNFAQSWFLNFAQIFGLPIRWANYDPNIPGLLEKVAEMLENMGSAAWAAFPTGTTMELMEPPKVSSENPQVILLDRADKCCDLLILGQTLTTDVGNSGSRALGNVHEDVRADVIQGAADFAASVINLQIIPAILQLNFGDDEESPEFCPEPKRVEDAKANAERDQILLNSGFKLPRDWAYKRHGVPLPQPNEEVIEAAPQMPALLGLPGGDPSLRAHSHGQRLTLDPTDQIINYALENLVPVQAQWLGAVKPVFHRLIALAQSRDVTDAELVDALLKAKQAIPGLFDKLDTKALANALYDSMSAAMVNGAVRGFLQRRTSPGGRP